MCFEHYFCLAMNSRDVKSVKGTKYVSHKSTNNYARILMKFRTEETGFMQNNKIFEIQFRIYETRKCCGQCESIAY